jgi:hypothetical protein
MTGRADEQSGVEMGLSGTVRQEKMCARKVRGLTRVRPGACGGGNCMLMLSMGLVLEN